MTLARVFLLSLLFALLAGAAIQLLIVPLTPWHAGSGLLAGGDWVSFQHIALRLADLIRHQGWTAWTLRPDGQAPSGIAAAIYVATGVDQPWAVLPVNAVLYAFSAICWYRVLCVISGSRKLALIGLLPLFLFPSYTLLYGQLHKDIWSLAGFSAIAYCIFAVIWAQRVPWHRHVMWFALLVFGNIAIWVVRPYALMLLLAAECMVVLMLLGAWPWHRRYQALVGVLLACFITGGFDRVLVKSGLSESVSVSPETVVQTVPCGPWADTVPLASVDRLMQGMACVRDGSIGMYPHAYTNIDTDVRFHDAADLLAYLPRATQIALWAPFPDTWFAADLPTRSRLFQGVAAVETALMYVAMAGLVVGGLACWVTGGRRDRLRLLTMTVLSAFFLSWMVIYAVSVVNVGSLYRVRLPAALAWFGLGVVGWAFLLKTFGPAMIAYIRKKN